MRKSNGLKIPKPSSEHHKITIFDKLSQKVNFATEIKAIKIDKTLFFIPKANFHLGSLNQTFVNWLRDDTQYLNAAIFQTSRLNAVLKKDFGIDLAVRIMGNYYMAGLQRLPWKKIS